eukprot:1355408-Pyramimonas_sp.AAC.1
MAGFMQLNAARGCYMVLTAIMTVTVVYTCSTDGSPFRSELLNPWMKATLVDFYTNVFVLLCWVWYKETSFVARVLWTLFFCGLGSIGTCAYVLVQLFQLSPGQPLHKILLRKSST